MAKSGTMSLYYNFKRWSIRAGLWLALCYEFGSFEFCLVDAVSNGYIERFVCARCGFCRLGIAFFVALSSSVSNFSFL